MVIDFDPLRRLQAVAAVAALGLGAQVAETPPPGCGSPIALAVHPFGDPSHTMRHPAERPRPALLFVALDDPGLCPRFGLAATRLCALPAGRSARGFAVVGFGSRAPLLAAHRLHGCTDLVMHLVAADGGPRLAHLPPVPPLDMARITTREADVLVLLLAGATDKCMAGLLGIAAATARAHVRALLRKLGAADRRALRARLAAAPSPASMILAGEPRLYRPQASASKTRPVASFGKK